MQKKCKLCDTNIYIKIKQALHYISSKSSVCSEKVRGKKRCNDLVKTEDQ